MKPSTIGPAEKGVPLPRSRSKLGRRICELKVGESFVTSELPSTVNSHARYYGIRVSYRSVENGQIRVWRIEESVPRKGRKHICHDQGSN